MIEAIGTEEYDKDYGLGYSVGHGELSPYPRVNRLRRTFLDRPFVIDVQRALLVTQSYKETEGEPAVIRCAKALEKVLDNVTLHIYDEELIIGDVAAPAKAAPVYPEFSVDWIIDELKDHPFEKREYDAFLISEADKKKLLDILPYWEGKTVADAVLKELDHELMKGSQLGKRVFMTNLYHFGGIGHFVMDYAKLMEKGFGGLIEEVKAAAVSKGEKDFYRAMLIELSAAGRYILRYADLAGKMAGECLDEKRRAELTELEKVCRQIAFGPAKDFYQALQLWHFATTIVQIESNGHSVSYGRMDQWLYPYYRADLDSGRVSKHRMQELLECAYIRMGNPSKLKDRVTVSVRNGRGWGGESLTIGGVDREGKDATNDLTFMMLEASVHTRLMNPWVCVRMHKDTPHELKVKTFECIRAGYGHPKLYNDETAIKVMQKKGMSLEDARDYAVVGCVEPDLPGKEFGLHDAAYVNMVKVLDLALFNGKCPDCSGKCPMYEKCGGKLGSADGSLQDCSDMDEVVALFKKQMDYFASLMAENLRIIERAHREVKPTPFASAFFDDCIERGLDLTAGGARYNFTGPQACGIASVADALSAISQLVFDEKLVSGSEFMEAIRSDWEGYEYLYTLVNSKKVHHFGNDDDYADAFYSGVFDIYCNSVDGMENTRGGVFTPGVYSVNANVGMGMNTPASFDGRKAGEPISDNMGPVHTAAASHDVSGPTAIANSVNKADHTKATNGTLLNWKFTPSCVAGTAGRENLIGFVDTYFRGGATHCQFNIMSSKMMRDAMERPQDYRDMLVRVAGYSAYFVELSKPLQMDLINRTELSF